MSWASFEPNNVADHPAAFVGPNVASAVVQSLETGILINQSIRFWARASNEPKIIKLLVSFVSIVAAFQTCVAFYNTWRVVVLGFGNWGNVVDLGWPDRIQPALNCIMAAPFQAFLIWRCWTAMGRRWIILAPLVTLLLATVIMNIFITSEVFSMFSNLSFTLSATKLTGPPREYMTAFVLTAVLDILITILMLWVLLQVKSQALSKRFEKTLTRVLRMMWEAALPPCACAVAACIIYREMSKENLWDVFFQSILGKLYVISLFVILWGFSSFLFARKF
ncbi:hypothetical protein DFH11DRAFT_1576462 [Phellopilus nigrolimitatus]|nr:hypothetical protein DFH11DRAFT_1576462 [Phellopilus nigrolimitatus]